MATAGSLIINVSARTEQLARGLASAKKMTKSFRSDLGDLASGALKMGSLLTGAAAGAVAFYTKRSMEAIDVTAKLSDQIGGSTEAITALQHQGELAGNSSDEVNAALLKLTKTIGEAKTGTGRGAAAFKALGISMQDLEGLDVDKRLGLIGDKLNQVTDGERRAVFMTDLFGKSGQNLGAFLLEGSAGIAAARKEADKLGITFNRIDAAKVEAANDSFTRLGALVEGLATQFSIKLAPFIEKINSKLVMMGVEGEGAAVLVNIAFQKSIQFVGKVADQVSRLVGILQSAAGAALKVGGVFKTIEIGKATAFGESEDAIQKLVDEANVIDAAAADLFDKANKSFDDFENNANSKSLEKFFEEINSEADKAAKDMTDRLGNALSGVNASEIDVSKTGKGGAGFRQIDLTKSVLATGIQKRQTVEDKQLAETNRLLGIIAGNSGEGFTAQ